MKYSVLKYKLYSKACRLQTICFSFHQNNDLSLNSQFNFKMEMCEITGDLSKFMVLIPAQFLLTLYGQTLNSIFSLSTTEISF